MKLWKTFALHCLIALSNLAISAVSLGATIAEESTEQRMISLSVRVVDPEGHPVAGATVIPWALRCSQGHGLWKPKGLGGSEPPKLMTDEKGQVIVPYPFYAVHDERVRTTEVTLSIDHPDFAYVMYEFINVPREDEESYEAKLQRGAAVEIMPLENCKPASREGLHVWWSDGRSWRPDVPLAETDDGALRIPPMPAGTGQVLAVRLEGERATHFSPLLKLDLKDGETVRKQVELRPAVSIKGRLSDNVPRPVKNGRLIARTLADRSSGRDDVNWFTWAPIAEDGTFIIDAWPQDEAIQIIALCDGFIGESGNPFELTKHLPKAAEALKTAMRIGWGVWRKDAYYRPQIFTAEEASKGVVLRMEPMIRCKVETVDEHGNPISGVRVASNPNVGWWNGGSQIYGASLVRGERLIIHRDYYAAADDKAFAKPFEAVADDKGRAEFELPVGKHDLWAEHDAYELPVVRGWRTVEDIELVAGQVMSPSRL
jgi:hypothetical protein